MPNQQDQSPRASGLRRRVVGPGNAAHHTYTSERLLSADLAAAPAWDSSSSARLAVGVAGVAEQEPTADFKIETAGA